MIEWVATAFSIVGNVLNIKKSAWGFVFWMVGNTIWIWIGYNKHLYGMATLFVVYNLMSLWGLWSWTRSNTTDKHRESADVDSNLGTYLGDTRPMVTYDIDDLAWGRNKPGRKKKTRRRR